MAVKDSAERRKSTIRQRLLKEKLAGLKDEKSMKAKKSAAKTVSTLFKLGTYTVGAGIKLGIFLGTTGLVIKRGAKDVATIAVGSKKFKSLKEVMAKYGDKIKAIGTKVEKQVKGANRKARKNNKAGDKKPGTSLAVQKKGEMTVVRGRGANKKKKQKDVEDAKIVTKSKNAKNKNAKNKNASTKKKKGSLLSKVVKTGSVIALGAGLGKVGKDMLANKSKQSDKSTDKVRMMGGDRYGTRIIKDKKTGKKRKVYLGQR